MSRKGPLYRHLMEPIAGRLQWRIIAVIPCAVLSMTCSRQSAAGAPERRSPPATLSDSMTQAPVVLESHANYQPPPPPPPPPPPAPPQRLVVSESELERRLRMHNAGGGELQISLAWSNRNDVDLHLETPCGTEVYFSRKRACGLRLDVDMNAGSKMSTKPVENITSPGRVRAGRYRVKVRFYKDRGGASGPTEYAVRVKHRGVSQMFSGQLRREKQVNVVHTFVH